MKTLIEWLKIGVFIASLGMITSIYFQNTHRASDNYNKLEKLIARVDILEKEMVALKDVSNNRLTKMETLLFTTVVSNKDDDRKRADENLNYQINTNKEFRLRLERIERKLLGK